MIYICSTIFGTAGDKCKIHWQLFTARRKAAEELNVISISSDPQSILPTNGMKSSILTKLDFSLAVIFMTRVKIEPSDWML